MKIIRHTDGVVTEILVSPVTGDFSTNSELTWFHLKLEFYCSCVHCMDRTPTHIDVCILKKRSMKKLTPSLITLVTMAAFQLFSIRSNS